MASRPHSTSEEQTAALGNVKRKAMQIDLLSGELVKGRPKAGNGRHIRLHREIGEPVANPGMAHFAGTGPAGKYCKDCEHCSDIDVFRGGRMRKPSDKPGEDVILPLRQERDACVKAAEMLDDMVQRGGIGANRACKYFKAKQ